jgi:LAO/AO transport system kinase
MEKLSVHERAYIRPSPSSGTLGGVAEKTREAMLVCEAAGYDVVIVETVGVGQSETAVAGMTDMFVLMQLPNAGDDLQAIKKGVMELADLVVINKADIDADAATRAQAQITSALRLLGQHGNPTRAPRRKDLAPAGDPAQRLARHGAWTASGPPCSEFKGCKPPTANSPPNAPQQALAWMWERIDAGLKQAFSPAPAGASAAAAAGEPMWPQGRVAASTAARNLLAAQIDPVTRI